MKKHTVVPTLLLAVSLFACGNKQDRADPPPAAKPTAAESTAVPAPTAAPAASSPGSCTNPSASQCTDYLAGDPSLSKDQCDLISGKFATTPCTANKKLGTCTLDATHKRLTYYPDGEDHLTAKLAADDCKTMSGSWAP